MNHSKLTAAAVRREGIASLLYGNHGINHSHSNREIDELRAEETGSSLIIPNSLQEKIPLAVNWRLPMVMFFTGLSRSSIYDRMNIKSPRHDPTFPKAHRLGTCGRSAVAWYAHEIQAWILGRKKENRP